jgi:hypothetical protein
MDTLEADQEHVREPLALVIGTVNPKPTSFRNFWDFGALEREKKCCHLLA